MKTVELRDDTHQLLNDESCQLHDDADESATCQLCDDEESCELYNDDDDEESLYELERKEYYRNVLAPQLKTLNRR